MSSTSCTIENEFGVITEGFKNSFAFLIPGKGTNLKVSNEKTTDNFTYENSRLLQFMSRTLRKAFILKWIINYLEGILLVTAWLLVLCKTNWFQWFDSLSQICLLDTSLQGSFFSYLDTFMLIFKLWGYSDVINVQSLDSNISLMLTFGLTMGY